MFLQYWVGDLFCTVRNKKLTDWGGICEIWVTEGGLGGVAVLGKYEIAYGGELETRVEALLSDLVGTFRRVSGGVPAVTGPFGGWKMDVDTCRWHLAAHDKRGMFEGTVERYEFVQATGAKAPAVVVGSYEGIEVRTVHERVRTYRERARGGTRRKRVSGRKRASSFWNGWLGA